MRSLAGCLYVRACPANTGSLRIAGDAVLINGLSERIVADILSMYGMNMNKYKNEIMISSRIKIRTNEAPVRCTASILFANQYCWYVTTLLLICMLPFLPVENTSKDKHWRGGSTLHCSGRGLARTSCTRRSTRRARNRSTGQSTIFLLVSRGW